VQVSSHNGASLLVIVEAHERTRLPLDATGLARMRAWHGAGLGHEYWDTVRAAKGGVIVASIVDVEELLLLPLLLLLQWMLQAKKED